MKYSDPRLDVIEIDLEDIIITSNLNDNGNPDQNIPGPWNP